IRCVRRRDQERRQDAARGEDGDPELRSSDIEKFIWCKAKEEKKAHTLIDAGYDSSLDGEAYGSIFFQNANNSVRATDEFMEAVILDDEWWTTRRLTGEKADRYQARNLIRQI